ncbi:MAG: InlB B-repeat-containing protein [Actinomycetes bacterium]|jgi:uncharacterized repeat protein (TIGR02543 family)|nr:InlB B-repeat-containing protein [Actinomycetes bacterium]
MVCLVALLSVTAIAGAAPTMTAGNETDLQAALSASDCTTVELTADITLTSALSAPMTTGRPAITFRSDTTGTTRTITSAAGLRHIIVTGSVDVTFSFTDVRIDGAGTGGGIVYVDAAKQFVSGSGNKTSFSGAYSLTINGADIRNCVTATTETLSKLLTHYGTPATFQMTTGAVVSTGDIIVNNSVFRDNRAGTDYSETTHQSLLYSGGGAIASKRDVYVTNSRFYHNKASLGGAVYAAYNCYFDSVEATGNVGQRGGVIYTNKGWYGAMTDRNSDGVIDDADAKLASQLTTNPYGYVEITDSTLNENRSCDWASVVFCQDPLTASWTSYQTVVLKGHNNICNNYSRYQIGALSAHYLWIYGTITADNNRATGENAPSTSFDWGEGAFFDGNFLVLRLTGDSSISNNVVRGHHTTAYGNNTGSAIHCRCIDAIVTNGTLRINGNHADTTGGYPITYIGGAIYLWAYNASSTNTVMKALPGASIEINNNEAAYGGAIGAQTYSGNIPVITLINVTMANNSATGYGGGIYSSGPVTLDGSTIRSNTAAYLGGGVYTARPVVANDSTLSNNSAANGGAIYSGSYGSVTTSNTAYAGNTANGDGGAIYAENSVTAVASTFTDNLAHDATNAGNGGAIYTQNSTSWVNLTGSSFSRNTADSWGGAVSQYGSSGSATVTDCSFDDNRVVASSGTAGALFTYGPATVTGATFEHNSASGSGGALYSYGTLDVTDSIFTANTAVNLGGAVYAWDRADLTGTTFTDNTAQVFYAGALYLYSGPNTLTDCSFAGNAAPMGGAVYVVSTTTTTTIAGSDFNSNTATDTAGPSSAVPYSSGGAIYTRRFASLDITDTAFANNAAPAVYRGLPTGDRDGDGTADATTYDATVANRANSYDTSAYQALYNNADINYPLVRAIYRVWYNENGGVGPVPALAFYNTGDSCVVTYTPEPTRVNYSFVGWSFDPSATAADFVRDVLPDSFIVSADTTLYAVWRPIPQLRVTYDANGGTGSVPLDAGSYLAGDAVTVLFAPLPTRPGYSFLGWAYSSLAAAPDFSATGATTFTISADTTLYAVWAKNTQPPVNPPTPIDDGSTVTTPTPTPPDDLPPVTPPQKLPESGESSWMIYGALILAGLTAVWLATRKRRVHDGN